MRLMLSLLALSLLAACTPLVPATTPPQLAHTPGVFIRVTDEQFSADFFRVNYPQDWRVVKTSIASAALQVVFVSPDETMSITLSETPLDAVDTPYMEVVPLGERVLYVAGQAPSPQWRDFETVFERIVNSIQPLSTLE